MDSDEASIRKTYADYLAAFHTLDAGSVAPFYETPCLFVSDRGVVSMSKGADVETLFSELIEGLKSRNYARSEVSDLRVRLLSDHLALVSGLAVRFDTSGAELERTNATYTLRKTEDGWKFVTVIAHERGVVLSEP